MHQSLSSLHSALIPLATYTGCSCVIFPQVTFSKYLIVICPTLVIRPPLSKYLIIIYPASSHPPSSLSISLSSWVIGGWRGGIVSTLVIGGWRGGIVSTLVHLSSSIIYGAPNIPSWTTSWRYKTVVERALHTGLVLAVSLTIYINQGGLAPHYDIT
ncbi:hypothetical protein F4604DRAFT_1683369 [Suillus subluteus]|nr:hypothetical protein F4604DRAFT_1683369 [Suillus subluteus]